ncbi:MAG: hypothetical protein ACON4N_08575 [Myxococcota bacterium]
MTHSVLAVVRTALPLTLVGAAYVTLTACTLPPERPNPGDFPGALFETGLVPIPNNCTTLQQEFSATASGYISGTNTGFATYEYQSATNDGPVTLVQMQACEPNVVPKYVAMHFFGVAQVQPGEHPVEPDARENGGFLFAFHNTGNERPIRCDDQPSGTVNITESGQAVLAGTFDVEVGCVDEAILDAIPRRVSFTGTFSANNIGIE